MWQDYCDFWKQGFNFHGKANRHQFWHPFIINAVIAFMLLAFGGPWFVNGLDAAKRGLKNSMLPTLLGSMLLILVIAYGLISMVPRYAVIMRRLRDCNFSKSFVWAYLIIKVLTYIVLIGSPLLSLFLYGSIIAGWAAVMICLDGACFLAMLYMLSLPTNYHQSAFLGRWRK